MIIPLTLEKAIDNLGTYRDLTVIDEILPILQEKIIIYIMTILLI